MKTAREKARKLKEAEAAKLATEEAAATEGMAEGEEDELVRAGEKRRVGVSGSKSAQDEPPQAKRPKIEEQSAQVATAATDEFRHVPVAEEEAADGMGDRLVAEEEEAAASPIIWTEPISSLSTTILTKPHHEMRGHTSYLTFASLYPASVRAQIAEQGEKLASRMGTPAGSARVGTPRVAELVQEAKAGKGTVRAGSEDTEYGSEGIDAAIGTLTEDDFLALSGPP
jgi:tRNA (adenine57-N1/adenine58-N1)-methyltransferase